MGRLITPAKLLGARKRTWFLKVLGPPCKPLKATSVFMCALNRSGVPQGEMEMDVVFEGFRVPARKRRILSQRLAIIPNPGIIPV